MENNKLTKLDDGALEQVAGGASFESEAEWRAMVQSTYLPTLIGMRGRASNDPLGLKRLNVTINEVRALQTPGEARRLAEKVFKYRRDYASHDLWSDVYKLINSMY